MSSVKISEQHPSYEIEDEPTIEEKVKNLSVGDGKIQSKAQAEISVSQMLSQALVSGDAEMLEKALTVKNDIKWINATISRLPSSQVLLFLDSVTSLLIKRPMRAQMLVNWIKFCLLHHSSFLLSVIFV